MKNMIFKTILKVAMSVVPMTAVIACSEPDEPIVEINIALSSSSDNVTVSDDGMSAEVVLAPLGEEATINIDAPEGWRLLVDENGEWCSVNGSGEDVILSASEFVSDYTRSTMVRVAVGEKVYGNIRVSQSGTEVTTLALDHESILFEETGGAITVAVESNKEEWSVTGFEGESWLDVVEGDGSFTITTEANQVPYEFSTSLTVTAGTEANSKSVELDVVLLPWTDAYISIDREFIVIPEDGGELTIAVDTNREWEITSTGDWLDVVKDGNNIVISAEATSGSLNEATIHLQTTSGKDEASFDATVKQFIEPFVLQYSIPGQGAYIEVPMYGEVNCYIDWGDGTSSNYAGMLNNYEFMGHQYEQSGTYDVKMYGTASQIYAFYMSGVSNITAIVEWGNVGATDLQYAFAGTSINSIPDGYRDVFQKVTSPEGFYSIFRSCPNLETVPADLFNDLPQITSFSAAFFGCARLREIPGTLFDGCTGVTGIPSLFRDCTSLESIPEGLFDSMTDLNRAVAAFDNCTSLTSIPAHVFSANTKLADLYAAFRNCTGIVSIDPTFLDNNRKLTNLSSTFNGCTSLSGESPYSVIDGTPVHLYERADHGTHFSTPDGSNCFELCNGLSDWSSIPSDWQ